jgi:hypothetical protein
MFAPQVADCANFLAIVVHSATKFIFVELLCSIFVTRSIILGLNFYLEST